MKPIIIIFANDITYFASENLPKELKEDYHFITIQDPAREKVEVQVFSDKNIEPIELENLKNLVDNK